MTRRATSLALLGALLAAGGAQASCDMPGAVPLDPPPKAALAVAASMAGLTVADMADMPGDIYVSVFPTPDGGALACLEANTPATCSNGIVVCAHAITSTDFRQVYLETAAHQLTVSPKATGAFPTLIAGYTSNTGPVRQKFVFDGTSYILKDGG